jgi:hypothetical protein
MVLPLFAPGGVELAVVLLVSLLLFSPLVALAYVVLFRPDDATEERIAGLRERLDDGDATDPSDDDTRDDADGGDDGRRDDRDDRDGGGDE